jgi:hypothetical protein
MVNRIFGHWKSTLAGLVLALGQYLVIQGDSGFTWKTFLPTLATFIFGASRKDG